jgi:hypothetical protein
MMLKIRFRRVSFARPCGDKRRQNRFKDTVPAGSALPDPAETKLRRQNLLQTPPLGGRGAKKSPGFYTGGSHCISLVRKFRN